MKRAMQLLAVLWCTVSLAWPAAAAPPECESGWCLQNPQTLGAFNPQTNALWGSSGSDVFSVGYGGTIRHYDGTAWSVMDAPGGQTTLYGVWGSSGSDVFAVGVDHVTGRSLVLHYDGASWSRMALDPAFTWQLNDVWGTSGSDVYAVGSPGVLHYDGVSWTRMTEGYGSSVWGTSGSDLFVAGAGIRHFDGATWSVMVPPDNTVSYQDIWGSSGTDVYVVGYESTGIPGALTWNHPVLQHYDGTAWTSVSPGQGHHYKGIWGSSGSDVFVIGYDVLSYAGMILHFDGATWSRVKDLESPSTLSAVWGASNTDVFAAGAQQFVHFDGAAWSAMGTVFEKDVNSVGGSSPGDVYAVGTGKVLRFDGTSWTAALTDPLTELYGVWASPGGEVFAVGPHHHPSLDPERKGTILRYDGSEWTSTVPGQPYWDFYGVWGSSATDVFAVGLGYLPDPGGSLEFGSILHFDGTGWSPMDAPTDLQLFTAVWGSSANDVFAVGGGDMFHYNGSVWSAMDADTLYGFWFGVWGSSGNDVFAAGRDGDGNGAILHYDGAAWFRMDVGQVPPLLSIWGTSATDVYAVGVLATMLHYDGVRWTPVNLGLDGFHLSDPVNLYGMWGSSAANVYAVGTGGLVLHYSGPGPSWIGASKGTDQTAVLLSWENVAGETGYRLYRRVKGATEFAPVAETGADVAAYSDPVGFGSYVFEYRVAAIYPGEALSAFSPVDTGYAGGPLPVAPTLIAPAGAIGTRTPAYTWQAVSGADSYQLWVGTGSTSALSAWFTAAESGCGPGTGTCAVTPATSLAPGAWSFKVQARGAAGTGAWSFARDFVVANLPTAPRLLAPEGTVFSPTARFTWEPEPGVESYQLWIGTGTSTLTSQWVPAAWARCETGTCSFIGSYPRGVWYFNVRGRNAAGTGPWATAKGFNHLLSPPTTVTTLIAPSGVVGTATPTFTWSAQAEVESYQLWVGTGPATTLSQWVTAAAAGCGSGTGTCSLIPATPLPQGAFYFNVRARNAAGTGWWTTPVRFTVALVDPPGAVALLAPVGAAGTSTPIFSWAARAGVDSYLLWVGTATSTAFSRWYTADAAGCGSGSGTCTAAPGVTLAPGNWYYNVRGKNIAGTGPWASASGFMTP